MVTVYGYTEENNCTVNSEECLQNDKLGDDKIASYFSCKFKYFNSYNSHCLSSLLNEKIVILIWPNVFILYYNNYSKSNMI